jgi:hypothetical protein
MILAAASCGAAPVEQPVVCDGCQLAGHLRDADQTSFTVKAGDALFSAPTVQEVKSWQGVAQGTPNRMLIQLDLRIGGVAVKIPYKAYADLGNPLIPDGVSLTQGQGEIHLNIRGGEGSAAYIARFIVIQGKLVRREVVPAGTPDAGPDVVTFN